MFYQLRIGIWTTALDEEVLFERKGGHFEGKLHVIQFDKGRILLSSISDTR